jgi:hypothetical protein
MTQIPIGTCNKAWRTAGLSRDLLGMHWLVFPMYGDTDNSHYHDFGFSDAAQLVAARLPKHFHIPFMDKPLSGSGADCQN